jgi:hypothetical protein
MTSGFQYKGVDISSLVSPGDTPVNPANTTYYKTLPNINSSVVTGVYQNTVSNFGYYIQTTPTTTMNLTEYYIPYTAQFTTGGAVSDYLIPVNFKHFNAILVGGGGGGGASGNAKGHPGNSAGGAGGGGGGMYLFYQSLLLSDYFNLNPAKTQYVAKIAVGNGGGPGNAGDSPAPGNAGGSSSITGKSTWTANGGAGGGTGTPNGDGDAAPVQPGGAGGTGGVSGNSGYPASDGTASPGGYWQNSGPPNVYLGAGYINGAWGPILPPVVYYNPSPEYGVGGNGGQPISPSNTASPHGIGINGNAGQPGYIAIYLFRGA